MRPHSIHTADHTAPGGADRVMSPTTWLPYAAAVLALAVLLSIPRFRAGRATHPWGNLAARGAVLALMALVLAMLTDAAAEGDGLTTVDRPIWGWLIDHRTPLLTETAKALSDVGGTGVVAVVAVATAAILWFRHRRSDAVLIVAATAGAGLIVLLAKPVVGRVRPPEEFRLVVETNQSFPSGHAVASAAVIGVLAAVLVPSLQHRWERVLVRVLAAALVLAIGLSRLYLGVHWTTDVVGGWLAGTGWLLLCLTAVGWWSRRPARLLADPADAAASAA